MKLKPYPAYKDSGVPWLGEIPKHWQALPNRALFAEVNDRKVEVRCRCRTRKSRWCYPHRQTATGVKVSDLPKLNSKIPLRPCLVIHASMPRGCSIT